MNVPIFASGFGFRSSLEFSVQSRPIKKIPQQTISVFQQPQQMVRALRCLLRSVEAGRVALVGGTCILIFDIGTPGRRKIQPPIFQPYKLALSRAFVEPLFELNKHCCILSYLR